MANMSFNSNPVRFVTECPGHWRIPENRKWFVREGETVEQATYCQVCVEAGCSGLQKEKSFIAALNYANCDCPDPGRHSDPRQPIQYPTKDQNKLYADYLKTKRDLEHAQKESNWLQEKLANYYPKELVDVFENSTPTLDPEPLAIAKKDSRVHVLLRTHQCGCVEWRDGDDWGGKLVTWYCRSHIWKSY